MLVVEKLPEANTLEVTAGRRRGPRAHAAPASPASGRLVALPAGHLHREVAPTTSPWRCSSGSRSWSLLLLALLFDWRTALIAAITTLLVAGGRGDRAPPREGRRSTRWSWRGSSSPSSSSSTTSIVDAENVRRRLRLNAEAGDGSAGRRPCVEASLEVRSPLAYATLHRPAGPGADLRPEGRDRRVRAADRARLRGGGVGVDGGRAGHHAGAEPAAPGQGAARGAASRRSCGRSIGATTASSRGSSAVLAWRIAAVACRRARRRRRVAAPRARRTHSSRRSRTRTCWSTGMARPGTSLPEMNRITARVSRELRSLPGVRDVGAHVGRAVLADQVVNVNSGELWVEHRPLGRLRQTVSSIQQVVNGYPGLEHSVLTYPEGADPAGARADGRATSRCASTAPTWRSCAARRTSCGARSPKIDGVSNTTVQR